MTTLPQTAPTAEPARKSPAEFERLAETFNASLDASVRDLAHARREIERQMEERESLIKEASAYGVTPKFARTLLRKP